MADAYTLPAGLPVPVDDGAADHLRGAAGPPLTLPATPATAVDLAAGASGCTPQSCGFRDLHAEFRALAVTVAGVSTQTTAYQREFVERNHVPFDLPSDAELRLTRALRLPTFEFAVAGGGPTTLIKRMARDLRGGRIARVWYPVFPPDRNAETVLAWLRSEHRR